MVNGRTLNRSFVRPPAPEETPSPDGRARERKNERTAEENSRSRRTDADGRTDGRTGESGAGATRKRASGRRAYDELSHYRQSSYLPSVFPPSKSLVGE